MDLAAQAAELLPAKCEGGMDLLMNHVFDFNMWYQHRGHGYRWAPPMLIPGGDNKDLVDKWGPDAVEFYPFCLYLTHGRTTVRNQTHAYGRAGFGAGLVGLALGTVTVIKW